MQVSNPKAKLSNRKTQKARSQNLKQNPRKRKRRNESTQTSQNDSHEDRKRRILPHSNHQMHPCFSQYTYEELSKRLPAVSFRLRSCVFCSSLSILCMLLSKFSPMRFFDKKHVIGYPWKRTRILPFSTSSAKSLHTASIPSETKKCIPWSHFYVVWTLLLKHLSTSGTTERRESIVPHILIANDAQLRIQLALMKRQNVFIQTQDIMTMRHLWPTVDDRT